MTEVIPPQYGKQPYRAKDQMYMVLRDVAMSLKRNLPRLSELPDEDLCCLAFDIMFDGCAEPVEIGRATVHVVYLYVEGDQEVFGRDQVPVCVAVNDKGVWELKRNSHGEILLQTGRNLSDVVKAGAIAIASRVAKEPLYHYDLLTRPKSQQAQTTPPASGWHTPERK